MRPTLPSGPVVIQYDSVAYAAAAARLIGELPGATTLIFLTRGLIKYEKAVDVMVVFFRGRFFQKCVQLR